jgi:hypothetical protein
LFPHFAWNPNLQSCHIPPPSAERLVFFANVFNTLMLHGMYVFEQFLMVWDGLMAAGNSFHMLAKSVIDGQNFRRVMETFMSDVQYDPLCGWSMLSVTRRSGTASTAATTACAA